MKSIKMTDEEKAAQVQPMVAESMPDYPYGTCVCLCADTLAKLGITKLPAAGAVVEVFFRGTVTKTEVEADGEPCHMSIQICEMDPPKEVKSDAETLYGED